MAVWVTQACINTAFAQFVQFKFFHLGHTRQAMGLMEGFTDDRCRDGVEWNHNMPTCFIQDSSPLAMAAI